MSTVSGKIGTLRVERAGEELLLGGLLVQQGKLSEPDVNRVIAAQHEEDRNLRFGEAAQRLGLITEHDLRCALSQQFKYRHVADRDASGFSHELVAATEPFGAEAEALRTLRGQLSLTWFNEQPRVLAVSATHAAAGTSTIAANLAILFAQLDKRTLLLDANLRRPGLQALFGLGHGPGLSQVLAGRARLMDAVLQIAPFRHLAVLPAGAVPPNPHELLSRSLGRVLEAVRSHFDVVIVDTPPLSDYADTLTVAAQARGMLLVIRRDHTRISDLERVRAQLAPSGAQLVGAVVSG